MADYDRLPGRPVAAEIPVDNERFSLAEPLHRADSLVDATMLHLPKLDGQEQHRRDFPSMLCICGPRRSCAASSVQRAYLD